MKFDYYRRAKLLFSAKEELPDERKYSRNENGGVTIGIKERYWLIWFYHEYYKLYDTHFLWVKTKKLADGPVKSWVQYCILHMELFIEEENENFDSELEEFAKYSSLPYKNLYLLFNKYKPFLTQHDYFRFAYDHMDDPIGIQFLVLLLIWIDNDYPINPRFQEMYQKCKHKESCKEYEKCRKEKLCTIRKKCYAENYDFEEEMREFERELINDFTTLAPFKNNIKEKALPYMLKMFDEINKTGRYRDKLSLSINKILYSKEMPLTGKLYIPWDKVDFYNGFYLIQHPKTPLKDTSKFYTVKDPSSRKAFNDISSYFLKRLPPIYVEFKNGEVQKILNTSNLSTCISIMEYKVSAPAKEKKKGLPNPHNGRKVLSKSEAKQKCKELKSRFLDYLANSQVEDYNVICSIENRVNASNDIVQTEYSFIFTIKLSGNRLFLAYENVQDSRCTYIFPVSKSEWEKSVDTLYDFFGSNETNKRQALSRRVVDLNLPGNYEFKRIMHTDYQTWENKIKYCHVL